VLRGLAMGTADVMPGVSGGTMALVLGIYERLVAALRAATSLTPWRLLARGRVRGAWRAAHAPFLAPLVAGIAIAVLILSRVIERALELYAVPLYAVFAGLILAAAVLVGRRVVRWHAAPLAALVAAAVAVTLLLSRAPQAPPDTLWAVFVAGAIGIAALVLPGISGAFILVLLGQYGRVISAIASLDLVTLVPFALGALVGLATVARLLDLLLRRALDVTMAALLGVMLGSLQRVWPWTLGDGYAARLVAPAGAWGLEGWVLALIVALLAFGAVLGLDRVSGARIVTRDVSSSS
jgi:putative membrane protein